MRTKQPSGWKATEIVRRPKLDAVECAAKYFIAASVQQSSMQTAANCGFCLEATDTTVRTDFRFHFRARGRPSIYFATVLV